MPVSVASPGRRAGIPAAAVLLCAAAVAHGLLDPRWHALWTVCVIFGGTTAFYLGVRRNAPPAGSGWQLAAGGLAVYASGDVAYVILAELVDPEHPVMTAAWFGGLIGMPFILNGLRRALSVGDPVVDAEGRIDAAIIATAVGFAGWHLIVAPQIALEGWTSYGVLGSTTFWVAAVITLGFLINRAMNDGGFSPSLAFLAAAIPLTAFTSLVYFVHESAYAWVSAPVARPLMALSYAAGAAATWHPSMTRGPRPRAGNPPGRSRFLAVSAGILLVPLWHLLAATSMVPTPTPDVLGSITLCILAILCLARLDMTLRARDRAAAALAHQANQDSLTGLPNRAQLMTRLQAAVDAAPDGRGVGLIALDLDRFKVVNDSLGHPAGDQLLIGVAQRLLRAVDGAHMVARLGGDEFVVLCEQGAEETTMVALAHRLRRHLAAPMVIDGHELGTTASLGIATLGPHATTAADLLRDADVALYRAKDDGRDGVALFDAAVRARITSRMHTERALRHALADDGFALAYQPVRALDSGRIVGVEALLRWAAPERHEASPLEMIHVAEETGLIQPVGAWVLERAARDLAVWLAAHPGSDLMVGINVSGLQLGRPGFADWVLATLAAAGVAPHHLVIELTESVMIDEWARPRRTLAKLRREGVKVSMDDFGTGYAALAILRRFPFDSVKIDRAFVAGLVTGDGDIAIVRAMIGMAHGLGMRVVGEGVEGQAEFDLLSDLGCDLVQGFHVGRPEPWAAVTAAMSAGGAVATS